MVIRLNYITMPRVATLEVFHAQISKTCCSHPPRGEMDLHLKLKIWLDVKIDDTTSS